LFVDEVDKYKKKPKPKATKARNETKASNTHHPSLEHGIISNNIFSFTDDGYGHE